LKQALDWSAYRDAGMGDAYADIPNHGGDYAKAIALCINSGQCETDSKLVMCPSFKVSADPHLSTGGRVRLLKAALGDDDWEAALAHPDLARAMDLCVSCKGCKRECDNNVDMALIKAEYLAWRAQKQGLSWRSQLFAHTPIWLHRLPWLRHAINLRNRSGWLRTLSERCLGLSKNVALPNPVAKPFIGAGKPSLASDDSQNSQATLASLPEQASLPQQASLPEVVLWVDTFTRYFDPEIAEAALAVLQAGGYSVQLAGPAEADSENRPLCCGRTYLAQGMVAQARNEASRLVTALAPLIASGKIVVGLEASCVLGLRDDALALGLGEPMHAISKNVFLLEEFLTKEMMAKRLKLTFAQPKLGTEQTQKTLVHGHCHQKAVGAMKAVRKVLKLIPNLDFEIIDSGCCGMAGTFGLEAEHQSIASEMANKDLLPTLQSNPEAAVIANGFSCRQQMRAHGDARAKHLAIILRDALL